MADKKDFSAVNTGRVYHDIETATTTKGQQGSASPQEANERRSKMTTQGRKGCKAIRINMAFTPENHQYIAVMARIRGMTLTKYTNYIIEKYREEHPEIYDQAKAIIDREEHPELYEQSNTITDNL